MVLWLTIIGVLFIIVIAWYFGAHKKDVSKAQISSSGYQEQIIKVKAGYIPDTVMVQTGKPVRLIFIREEKAPCSEMVLFSNFNKSAVLPYGKNTTVEIMPTKAGTYPFSCQMGMYKGTLIVKE